MKDKERILMALLKNIYASCLFDEKSVGDFRALNNDYSGKRVYEVGDLVVAFTTITPNEYMVGYVHNICDDCVEIREIGSDRICKYYNESFIKIDKSIIGYEILEGVQYKTYQKALKAVSRASCFNYRFGGIEFSGNVCMLGIRKVFSEEEIASVSFKYNSKTTISRIEELVDDAIIDYENKNGV